MRHDPIIVRAEWDGEAGVFVVTSADVPGLAVEAERFEDIERKAGLAIGDLAEFSPAIAVLAGRRLEVHAVRRGEPLALAG
jgi:hypothetical protein